jgi:hypothetical protein
MKRKTTGFLISLLMFCRAQAGSGQTAANDVILAQVATGGGYTSHLNISDPVGSEAQNIRVLFYDDAGKPLPLSVDGAPSASSYIFLLEPHGERTLVLTSGSLRTGWVKVAGNRDSKVDVSLRFSFAAADGTVSDAVGILPSDVTNFWTLTFDRRTPNDLIGVAVVNPHNTEQEVSFDLYQGGRRASGTGTVKLTLPALGHRALFLHELFNNLPEGSTILELAATANVAVVALRGDGPQYSSLPPYPGVEMWDWSITTPGGQTYWAGRWCLRFGSDAQFTGVSTDNSQRWDVTGKYGSSSQFQLESFVGLGDDIGIMLFFGTWIRTETGRLINGKYMEIKTDGSVQKVYNFQATLH